MYCVIVRKNVTGHVFIEPPVRLEDGMNLLTFPDISDILVFRTLSSAKGYREYRRDILKEMGLWFTVEDFLGWSS